MARIPLRAYNKEIEAKIDRNEIDEAIVNCLSILESFPKHVDTYRLMGKALLEGQRFSDAADVFHRVLSSVPDDFIAHLGMSIIREDEGNLDSAIWHMERSFEVQPSNAAVQVELRRLYGLRDGLTPQKIQLTRGALARMSAKSNLYSQAIAELRTALSEDPQRPDLQVVLATMYAQTGAKMEAIEICNTLLSKLPYCLEANRILANLLPDTERAELAQVNKDRLIELDPYFAHISAVAGTVDQVPDSAITIERNQLASDEDGSIPLESPDWASSLGIALDEEPSTEDRSPEWLSADEETPEFIENVSLDLSEEEEEKMIEKEPESSTPEPAEPEDLPDWMSDTDWEEASEDSEEGGEETPEWLRDVMESPDDDTIPETTQDVQSGVPEDVGDEPSEVEEEGSSGEVAGAVLAGAALESLIESNEDSEEQVLREDQLEPSIYEDIIFEDEPDLQPVELEEISEEIISEEEEGGPNIGETVVPAIVLDEKAEEQTDTLLEDSDTFSEDQEEVPDWLQDLGEGIPEEEVQLEASSQDIDEPLTEPEDRIAPPPIQQPDDGGVETEDIPDNLPEWLSSVSPESLPDDEISESVEPGEEPGIVLARIPAWLKQMEQEHLAQMAKESEKIEELDVLEFDSEITELTGEDVPSWLMDAMEPEIVGEAEATETIESIDEVFQHPLAEEPTDVELQEIDSMPSEPLTEEDMAPESVDQIVEEPSVESDTHPVVIAQPVEEEIVDKISEDELVPELTEEDMGVTPEEIEEQPVSPEEPEEAPTFPEDAALSDEDEDAAMAWLESLAEKQGVSEEELITPPEDRQEEPPEWVQELVPEEEEPTEEDAEGIREGFAAAAIAGLAIGKQMDDEEREPIQDESAEIVAEDELSEWISDFEEPEVEESAISEITPTIDSDMVGEELESEAESDLVESGAVPTESAVMGEQITDESEPEIQSPDLLEEPAEEISADESPKWTSDRIESEVEAMEAETIEPLSSVEVEGVPEETEEDQLHIEVEDVAAAAITGAIIEEVLSKEEPQAHKEDLSEETEQDLVDAEQPEWLSASEESDSVDLDQQLDLVKDDVKDEMDTEFVSPTEETSIEEPEADEWYQDLEADGVSTETPSQEWTPALLVEEEAPSEDTQEIQVDTKLDLNAASLSQLERIPSIGFIHAQRIINYRETAGPFKDFEELGKVPGISSEILEELKKYLTVEVVAETAPPLSSHPEMQNAWNSISAGEIEKAIDQYNRLINKDENLDEVIRDLQEAIIKFPSDVSLYQTLGDAYLHANLLQEALDAYSRAEDLIT